MRFRKVVDQPENENRPLKCPEIGKINVGVSDQKEKSVPYFLVPEEVANVYSDEPKELDVVFLSNDILDVAPQNYCRFNSKGLACEGNGVDASEYVIKKQGDKIISSGWEDRKCGKDNCKRYGTRECTLQTHLSFMIPKASMAGVYVCHLSGVVSQDNVLRGIQFAKQLCGGSIKDLPFVLYKTEEKYRNAPGVGKIKTYDVALRLALTLDELLNLKRHGNRSIHVLGHEQEDRLALPSNAPTDVDYETGEVLTPTGQTEENEENEVAEETSSDATPESSGSGPESRLVKMITDRLERGDIPKATFDEFLREKGKLEIGETLVDLGAEQLGLLVEKIEPTISAFKTWKANGTAKGTASGTVRKFKV